MDRDKLYELMAFWGLVAFCGLIFYGLLILACDAVPVC